MGNKHTWANSPRTMNEVQELALVTMVKRYIINFLFYSAVHTVLINMMHIQLDHIFSIQGQWKTSNRLYRYPGLCTLHRHFGGQVLKQQKGTPAAKIFNREVWSAHLWIEYLFFCWISSPILGGYDGKLKSICKKYINEHFHFTRGHLYMAGQRGMCSIHLWTLRVNMPVYILHTVHLILAEWLTVW